MIKCYSCKKQGHYAIKCPNSDKYKCTLCLKKGRIELHCTKKCELCDTYPYHHFNDCTNKKRFEWAGMHLQTNIHDCDWCNESNIDCDLILFDQSRLDQIEVCDICVKQIAENFDF